MTGMHSAGEVYTTALLIFVAFFKQPAYICHESCTISEAGIVTETACAYLNVYFVKLTIACVTGINIRTSVCNRLTEGIIFFVAFFRKRFFVGIFNICMLF